MKGLKISMDTTYNVPTSTKDGKVTIIFKIYSESILVCINIFIKISVVDPNTLSLYPDPEFWPNLDLDPGLCYHF